MNPLTPTEIEELRIAIAEEMGWIRDDVCDCWYLHGNKMMAAFICDVGHFEQIPPYTTSIDAIQSACLERFKDRNSASEFSKHLQNQSGMRLIWQLTALDWCIAFARTAKIWRWKV